MIQRTPDRDTQIGLNAVTPPWYLKLISKTSPVFSKIAEPLGESGVILVIEDDLIGVLAAFYHQRFTARNAWFFPRITKGTDASSSITELTSAASVDVFLPTAKQESEAKIDLMYGLQLARATNRMLIPVGVSIGKYWQPQESNYVIPFPWARMVVLFEPPFHVPGEPSSIPDTWIATIHKQLQRANGRANDILATWKQHGLGQ